MAYLRSLMGLAAAICVTLNLPTSDLNAQDPRPTGAVFGPSPFSEWLGEAKKPPSAVIPAAHQEWQPGPTLVAPDGPIVEGPEQWSPELLPRIEVNGEEPTLPITARIRGRIHADALFADQSARNKAIRGDLQNGVGFRRARLGAQGTVGEQVRWVSEFDFAGGVVSFKNVFVALEELGIIRHLRVGHFPEPFSLEGETSMNALPLIERSPAYAIDPDRNWGVMALMRPDSELATLAIGAFRSGTEESGNDNGDGNDMAYTVRGTWLPWYVPEARGRRLLHVGGVFSQRYLKDDTLEFSHGPNLDLLVFGEDNNLSSFMPDFSIAADQNQVYNIQSAIIVDRLSLQGEWYVSQVHQLDGAPAFLHGGYLLATYFLTDDFRAYNREEGTFVMPRVNTPFVSLTEGRYPRGPGAWELTARFCYADFTDADIPRDSQGLLVGTRMSETTAGLSWYLNHNCRLMFNFVHAVPVDPNFGPSHVEGYFSRTEIFW